MIYIVATIIAALSASLVEAIHSKFYYTTLFSPFSQLITHWWGWVFFFALSYVFLVVTILSPFFALLILLMILTQLGLNVAFYVSGALFLVGVIFNLTVTLSRFGVAYFVGQQWNWVIVMGIVAMVGSTFIVKYGYTLLK